MIKHKPHSNATDLTGKEDQKYRSTQVRIFDSGLVD